MNERRRLGEPLFGYDPNAMNKEKMTYARKSAIFFGYGLPVTGYGHKKRDGARCTCSASWRVSLSAMIYHWISVSPPPIGIWSPVGAGDGLPESRLDCNAIDATVTSG